AEDGGAAEPVGERDRLLGIRARRPGAGCGLVDLLLRLLTGGLLLVELAVQLLDLLLGLPERLLEDPQPPLRGALRERPARGTEQQEQRQASCDDPSSFPVRSDGHACSFASSIDVPPVPPVGSSCVWLGPPVDGSACGARRRCGAAPPAADRDGRAARRPGRPGAGTGPAPRRAPWRSRRRR